MPTVCYGWWLVTAPRKRRVRKPRQGELDLVRDKNGQRRGGKRPGAGKKPRIPGRPGSAHTRRPEVDPRKPQHVTLRVLGDVGHLRRPHMYRAIRGALATIAKTTAERDDFRIVHFSLQGDHIHPNCEASSREARWRGGQRLEISPARRLNDRRSKATRRRRTGTVFADRYHARAIGSVREMRNLLNYVLNNWRHHPHGDRGPRLFGGKLDPYSSAVFFPGWKERTLPLYVPAGYDAPIVGRPRSWLLAEGWKYATPISVWEVPGNS